MSNKPTVTGAHLVGSVNLDTAEDVFRMAASCCGDDLASLPDGEPGERFHWVLFQGAVFGATPQLARVAEEPVDLAGFDIRPFRLKDDADVTTISLPALGYARAAERSYATFSKLKADGVIPAHVKFQVSLPTPFAPIMTFIEAGSRAALEGPYEAALLQELREIIALIPAGELSIQWDMAWEFSILDPAEIAGFGVPEVWFEDPFEALTDRAARMADSVPADVRVGFHLCYGDVGEKHFKDPEDATHLRDVANALVARTKRHIDYVHMPVPIERDDAAYYAPLTGLRLTEGTKLYLGLLHREDGVAGAQRRIAAAGTAVSSFGVATECGMARGPREEMEPLLKQHHEAVVASA